MNMQSTGIILLSKYLADTFFLYLKTHNFHWNVTGPLFFSLHKMFEEQYNALFLSLDETAERIRTLDAIVPGTTLQLRELTCIDEPATVLAARDMIQILVEDHSKIIDRLRNWVYETADDAGTQDYLLQRLEAHEKMVWMLKASF
jgi:starvation-inducible DNA-binding protein